MTPYRNFYGPESLFLRTSAPEIFFSFPSIKKFNILYFASALRNKCLRIKNMTKMLIFLGISDCQEDYEWILCKVCEKFLPKYWIILDFVSWFFDGILKLRLSSRHRCIGLHKCTKFVRGYLGYLRFSSVASVNDT